MKVSGFSIIRNGVKFDYPYLESYRSLLPLVDELILVVGEGEDSTLDTLVNFQHSEPKIKIIETRWPLDDPKKTIGGHILSEQTNIGLQACTGDWCFYLQSDEVLHEKDYTVIRKGLEQAHGNLEIEGLVFSYEHFYSAYNVVQKTRSAYRREVRIVRSSIGAKSVGDAQSFRKETGEKLNAALIDASIYHYGWVRHPDAMKAKTFSMDELYHGKSASEVPHTKDNYKYKRFWGLREFKGTHPRVMHERIEKQGWTWNLAESPYVFHFKDLKKVLSDAIEWATGVRLFEYQSYRLIDHL